MIHQENFHFEAFVAIPGANNKLVLAKHDWRYHWWKSEAYFSKEMTNNCCWASDSYMAIQLMMTLHISWMPSLTILMNSGIRMETV